MFRSSIPGVRLIFPPRSPPRHQNCPLWARCLWCQPTTQGSVPAKGQYLPVKQNASHFRIFGNIIIILVTVCSRSSWGPTLSCTCRATWPGTGEASAGTPSPSWGRAPGASSGPQTTRQTTLRMSSARGGSKRRWAAMWRVIRVLTRTCNVRTMPGSRWRVPTCGPSHVMEATMTTSSCRQIGPGKNTICPWLLKASSINEWNLKSRLCDEGHRYDYNGKGKRMIVLR